MSVCVVAQYAWRAIKQLVGSEPPAMIMCSDTRICVADTLQPFNLHWQNNIVAYPRNLSVCYTSSSVDVTIKALDSCAGTSNVRRVGTSLREHHFQSGGVTELIAVVSDGGRELRLLQVMPLSYVRKLRTGIVGIGSSAVLQRFKELFMEDLSLYCPLEATPEMIEGISRAVGYPVTFRSRFSIDQAVAHIVSFLTQAIEDVNCPSVGLPVQATAITKEGYTHSMFTLTVPTCSRDGG